MSDTTSFYNYAGERITTEIACLPGNAFEQWGYFLMRFVEPTVNWDHRGTTTTGSPRGYSVDSAGDHARIVAQYSVEADYFGSDKPLRDLESTFAKHPAVERIWLLAGKEASPSGRTRTDNAIRQWQAAHGSIEVRSWDARQIAAFILEHLDSDAVVEALSAQLPCLERLAEESAFSHSLPELGAHVERPELLETARAIISKNRYVILGGISGVGKSDLAVKLVQELGSDSAGWIDATQLKTSRDLKAIPISRRGLALNVAYLLKERPWTLVLDNLPTPWSADELRALVGSQSWLIVTSQTGGTRDDVVEIGNFDEGGAKKLLELDAPLPCPPDVFQAVWNATKGHPLLLRLIGNLAEENRGDWSIIRECCATIVSFGEDNMNEKICRRVLKQHLPAIENELKFFRWSDSASVDSALLAKCTSPIATANLAKRHVLAAATDRATRLHDIVFQSVQELVDVSDDDLGRYRQRLDNFIAAETPKHTPLLDRVSRRHEALFTREFKRQESSEVLYALARSRVAEDFVNGLGDLVTRAKGIVATEPSSEIAVRAVIEAIEATHSIISEKFGRKEAIQRLRELMPAFDVLLDKGFPKKLKADIRHHRAKMLVRLGERTEAEAEFRALLHEDSQLDGTVLQLVRLLGKTQNTEALNLALTLVDPGNPRPTLTVRISAWVEIARLKRDIVVGRVDEIVKTLEGVRNVDISAAYGLVAQVVSALAYKAPKAALALFSTIKDNEPVFTSMKERCDWARAQVGAAKALRDEGSQAEAVDLLQRARETYGTVPPERMSDFYITQYAENLLLLDDPSAAKQVLDRADERGRSEFWWYRFAQAQLGLEMYKAAFEAAETALRQLQDETYRPAFLEVRANARLGLQDKTGAVADLESAISLLQDEEQFKYRNQLMRRLDSMQKNKTVKVSG